MKKLVNNSLDSVNRFFSYESIHMLFFLMAVVLVFWAAFTWSDHYVEYMMASFLVFLPFAMVSMICFRRSLIDSVKKGDNLVLKNGFKVKVVKVNKETFIVKSKDAEFEVVKGIVFDNLDRK